MGHLKITVMKTFSLVCLYFIVCLITSCAKSPGDTKESNVTANKAFVPVSLFGSAGNWGGSVCSWGFVMVRQDSSIAYHSIALPANTTLTTTPVLVNILFHDTVQLSSCWREIVIDSIKF